MVRRLAVAADKYLEFHANVLESHAILMRASGAALVIWKAPKLVEVFHVVLFQAAEV